MLSANPGPSATARSPDPADHLRSDSEEVRTADALLSVVGPKHNDSVVMVEIRHLGGAAAKPSEGSRAGGNRNAEFCMNAIAVSHSEQQEAMEDWEVARIQEAIAPWATGRVFLNGLSGARVAHRVRAAFSVEQYTRLASIKRKYDPANLFCLNRNIAPAH